MSITKKLRVILSENTTNSGNNSGANQGGNSGNNSGNNSGANQGANQGTNQGTKSGKTSETVTKNESQGTKEITASVPDTGGGNSSYQTLSSSLGVAGFFILVLVILYLVIKRKNQVKSSSSRVNYKRQNAIAKKTFVCLGFLVSAGLLFASTIDFSHAQEIEKPIYRELPISSEDSILTLNADTLGSDEIRIIEDEITVDRDYENGLKFIIYGSNTELINETDRRVSIPSITEAGTLKNNTFGFTFSDPSSNPQTATFYPLEEYSENLSAFEISKEPVKSGTKVPIWFAVRSKDLTPGTYDLEITYKAVSDFTFKMQDMDSTICSELVSNKQYEFTDTRDGKTYTVAKLPDGQCWMTADLELDLATEDDAAAGDKIVGVLRSTESGEEFVALNSENSDLDSEFHAKKLNTTLDEGWDTYHGEYGYPLSDEDLEKLKEASFYIYEPGAEEGEVAEKVYYYHYNTATAGSADYNRLLSMSREDDEMEDIYIAAEHSICPKGWSLPDNSKYEKLIAVYYGSENQNLENSPTNFRVSGNIYNNNEFDDFGRWINYLSSDLFFSNWEDEGETKSKFNPGYLASYPYPKSRTESVPTRGASYGDIYPEDYGSSSGFPVRCIASVESSKIIYNQNSNDTVENLPDSGIFELNAENEYKISDKVPVRPGYEFAGWSSVQGKIPEFQPGETITVETPTFGLFASWIKRLEGTESLQELTDSVCKTFEENVFYSLTDSRDDQEYLVAKLADGRCWMVEDLKLMLTAGEPLTADTTDLNSKDSYTPTFSTQIGGNDEWGSNEAHSQSENGTVYYSGYDATAMSLGGEKDTVVSDSICPRGWYLPSSADYGTLISYYGNLYNSPAALNLNGERDSYDGIYEEDFDRYGAYWTSTNGKYDDELVGYEFDAYGDYYSDAENSEDGHNIRCVLDAPSTLLITFHQNSDDDHSITGMPEPVEASGSRGVATFTLPNDTPSRYPYTFLGWWIDGWTDDYDSVYKPGRIITTSSSPLYTVWGSADSLYLYTTGGSMDGESYLRAPRNPNTNTVTFTLPEEEPLRNGYLFLGWCQQSDNCSSDMLYHPGDQYTAESRQYGDLHYLYAIWQEASPKAILDSTGNLDFVYDSNEYYAGNYYVNGEDNGATISTVCSMDNMNDYYFNCRNSSVYTANFTDSFKYYRPYSTEAWFWDDSNLTEISNLQNLNTTNTTNMNNMFAHTTSLTSLTLPNNFGKAAEDLSSMFFNASSLTSVSLPEGFGRLATDIHGMFSGASSLQSISLPVGFGKFATDINSMFYGASSLTYIELPEHLGSNARDISYIFSKTSNLAYIGLPEDFGRVAENIQEAFSWTPSLTSIALPEGFGSTATNISGIFAQTGLTSLNLPVGFGTLATNMFDTFSSASVLEHINTYNPNTGETFSDQLPEGFGSVADNMSGMFYKTLNLGSLTFPAGFGSVATGMEDMFNKAKGFRVLTFPAGFGSQVTNTVNMFKEDNDLEHIYVDAGTDWNSGAVENSSNMFLETTSLTNWSNENANDITNAHIGTGGYFEDVATKPAE